MGTLGEEHFRSRLAGGTTFRYSLKKGFDSNGLPYLIECAFALVASNNPLRGLHIGLNWSVPLHDPFQQTEFLQDGYARGLEALLAQKWIDLERNPISLIVHVTYPRFVFLDRGKGTLAFSRLGQHDMVREWGERK